jgi:PAS domain S-box-containing protein
MSLPEQYGSLNDLERIFVAAPDILCVLGFNGRFTLVNPTCSAILGFHADEIQGKFYLELTHPDDQHRSGLALRRLTAGEQSVVWHNRYLTKDGSYRKLQWHATVDIIRRELYAIARDNTDINPNDDLLQQSELNAVTTIENAMDGILRTAPNGQIILANPAAVQLLGFDSEEDLIARGPEVDTALFADAEDRVVLLERLGQEEIVRCECALNRKDGKTVWVAMKTRAVRHSNGSLKYYERLLRDMTEQRQVEEALRISETRYRSLVENAPFGIYRSSLDGRFLDVNHALVAILGYDSREEVMRLNIESDVYADPTMRGRLIQQFGNVERTEPVKVGWRRKDGTLVVVRLSARKVRDAYGVLEGFEVIAEQTP